MKLPKLLRDRKGVSITEVVVAMSIVVFVTSAAISLVAASINADAKFMDKSLALIGCENAVECIRFSDDDATLEKTLNMAGFEKQVESGVRYLLKRGSYTVEVRVETTQNELDKYVVIYNDDEIYEIEK